MSGVVTCARWFAAIVAMGYLVVMVVTGALPEQRQHVAFEARGVLAESPERVLEVVLEAGGKSLRLRRVDGGWARVDGDVLPPQAASILSRAVKFMHTSAPVRVFAPEEVAGAAPAEFGLESPRLSVTLSSATGALLSARFGAANADGFLHYMRVDGRDELFLMSRFVAAEWLAVAATQTP